MRLINTTTMEMEEFLPGEVPPYAILSHTWKRSGEVTLQEFQRGEGNSKEGYRKITGAANLVKGCHRYIWIDTCCIDKTNDVELSEAINSMYSWYENAAVCIVYLEDRSSNALDEGICSSRWFKRGWTLQELVAPRKVQFYGSQWKFLGSRADFATSIYAHTNIPRRILRGDAEPDEFTAACRMSWAARRETTRIEDMAYCLLGIFKVNMTLRYGEGTNSFRRFQEEFLKRHGDLTLLAWGMPQNPLAHPSLSLSASPHSLSDSPSTLANPSTTRKGESKRCLFAASPADFAGSVDMTPFASHRMKVSMTSSTLHITDSEFLYVVPQGREEPVNRFVLLVGGQLNSFVGIILIKTGPNEFQRDRDSDVILLTSDGIKNRPGHKVIDWHIDIEGAAKTAISKTYRTFSIHVPVHRSDISSIFVKRAAPTSLWDVQDRLFLRPEEASWTRYDMVLALQCTITLQDTGQNEPVSIVVLCDFRSSKREPRLLLFLTSEFPRLAEMFLYPRLLGASLQWVDVIVLVPEITKWQNSVLVNAAPSPGGAGSWYQISAKATKSKVQLSFGETEVYSVGFDVDPVSHGPNQKSEGELRPAGNQMDSNLPRASVPDQKRRRID